MSLKNKTLSEKTMELTKLIEWFDSDDFSIEEALEKYKEAEHIASEIENDLLSLKNEIKIVKQNFDTEN